MKVVIMAGGRGTRISELFPDIPKPLIPIEGVPVLERELVSLRDQGFKDFIMTVSYMSNVCIKVPQTETYMIQELHLPVYHCLCLMLEDEFFGEN